MPAPPCFALAALPAPARALAALLRGGSRLALLLLLIVLVRANDPPLTPLSLAEALALFALAPELAARCVLRAYAARAEIRDGALVITRSDRVARVPIASIAVLAAPRIPLPLPSLTVALRSGAQLTMRLALADPRGLLVMLREAGCPAAAAARARLPVRYAAARADFGRPWWLRWPARIAAFALLPAAVAFSAHQHIAFGAFLGEYYLMGLAAWLRSAFAHYGTGVLHLVLWSGAWRIACEGFSYFAARSERAARAARILAEHATSAIYYGSVPALLALRFLG
jgi:apolipoprotein N-acyltransferase